MTHYPYATSLLLWVSEGGMDWYLSNSSILQDVKSNQLNSMHIIMKHSYTSRWHISPYHCICFPHTLLQCKSSLPGAPRITAYRITHPLGINDFIFGQTPQNFNINWIICILFHWIMKHAYTARWHIPLHLSHSYPFTISLPRSSTHHSIYRYTTCGYWRENGFRPILVIYL